MRAESTKETVLVTGSSGLIGRAVAERLSGHVDVVGFDRGGPPPHPPVTVECVCVDVTSEESVRMGLERVRYAYGTRIAAPMIGGMVSSTVLTLVLIPIIYEFWRARSLPKAAALSPVAAMEPV